VADAGSEWSLGLAGPEDALDRLNVRAAHREQAACRVAEIVEADRPHSDVTHIFRLSIGQRRVDTGGTPPPFKSATSPRVASSLAEAYRRATIFAPGRLKIP
jgi:hypothetical protein